MSYLIILSISLVVIPLYHSVAKNAAYRKAIDSVSPSWNVNIELN